MPECAKCGHQWPNETKKCPKCQTRRWNGAPTPAPALEPAPKPMMECPKCFYAWAPKVDNPKNCPKCKADLSTVRPGKKYAKRLAAMAGPVVPYVGTPELVSEGGMRLTTLLATYEWTGERNGDFGLDPASVTTDIDDLNPEEHYPVLEVIPGPMSELPHNDYILRGWIRKGGLK